MRYQGDGGGIGGGAGTEDFELANHSTEACVWVEMQLEAGVHLKCHCSQTGLLKTREWGGGLIGCRGWGEA